MTTSQAKQLREEFLAWSGGFAPREMATEDVEFWIADQADQEETRREIERWMNEETAKS